MKERSGTDNKRIDGEFVFVRTIHGIFVRDLIDHEVLLPIPSRGYSRPKLRRGVEGHKNFDFREPAPACPRNFPRDRRTRMGEFSNGRGGASAGYARFIGHLHPRISAAAAAEFTDGPIQPIYLIPPTLPRWTDGPYNGCGRIRAVRWPRRLPREAGRARNADAPN